MRAPLRIFPATWRRRYGDDFAELFAADPRRWGKWPDALRTAAGLRWEQIRTHDEAGLVLLAGAAGLVSLYDVGLRVAVDTSPEPAEVARHWWGAPFVALLAAGVTLAVMGLSVALSDRRRWLRAASSTIPLGASAVVGSALASAVASTAAAGIGAGCGFAVGAAATVGLQRRRLSRWDLLVAAAVLMAVYLAWRTAASPVGPIVVVASMGVALSTRVPAPARA